MIINHDKLLRKAQSHDQQSKEMNISQVGNSLIHSNFRIISNSNIDKEVKNSYGKRRFNKIC